MFPPLLNDDDACGWNDDENCEEMISERIVDLLDPDRDDDDGGAGAPVPAPRPTGPRPGAGSIALSIPLPELDE